MGFAVAFPYDMRGLVIGFAWHPNMIYEFALAACCFRENYKSLS
jgi:hypothetical protein